jgi:2-polyprenyl-6-methoxyphenol hydroxylase-like FAD-dependent oxidoreductase
VTPLDIAIVGYGTVGQALAVLLARDGHRLQVFEQAPEPRPIGAGFLLQPTGLGALWQMGLLDAVLKHGRRIDRLYGDAPRSDGYRAVMDMRYAQLDARLFGWGLQRGALFEALRDAWPGHDRITVNTRIDTANDDGMLVDARGQRHGPFDLVIAADGAHSALRQSTPDLASMDAVYPWGALWCLCDEAGWAHANELRQRYRQARKMVGVLPVGTRPGDAQSKLSFFWSLPRSAFEAWERDGLDAWKAELAALWPEAAALVAGIGEVGVLARASYRDVVMRGHWHRGRVVFCGDAAHAMSPQLGQGVNMALLDALALRDALRDFAEAKLSPNSPLDVARDRALRGYARQRRRHVGIYQFSSRWLTPVFQSERDAVARLRDALFVPMGRLPGGSGPMLRVLTGTQRGWLGTHALPEGLLEALASQSGR